MKSFRPFGVMLAAVFALACATLAQASPPVSSQHPVMQAYQVDTAHAAVASVAAVSVERLAINVSPMTFIAFVSKPTKVERDALPTRMVLHVANVPVILRS